MKYRLHCKQMLSQLFKFYAISTDWDSNLLRQCFFRLFMPTLHFNSDASWTRAKHFTTKYLIPTVGLKNDTFGLVTDLLYFVNTAPPDVNSPLDGSTNPRIKIGCGKIVNFSLPNQNVTRCIWDQCCHLQTDWAKSIKDLVHWFMEKRLLWTILES